MPLPAPSNSNSLPSSYGCRCCTACRVRNRPLPYYRAACRHQNSKKQGQSQVVACRRRRSSAGGRRRPAANTPAVRLATQAWVVVSNYTQHCLRSIMGGLAQPLRAAYGGTDFARCRPSPPHRHSTPTHSPPPTPHPPAQSSATTSSSSSTCTSAGSTAWTRSAPTSLGERAGEGSLGQWRWQGGGAEAASGCWSCGQPLRCRVVWSHFSISCLPRFSYAEEQPGDDNEEEEEEKEGEAKTKRAQQPAAANGAGSSAAAAAAGAPEPIQEASEEEEEEEEAAEPKKEK